MLTKKSWEGASESRHVSPFSIRKNRETKKRKWVCVEIQKPPIKFTNDTQAFWSQFSQLWISRTTDLLHHEKTLHFSRKLFSTKGSFSVDLYFFPPCGSSTIGGLAHDNQSPQRNAFTNMKSLEIRLSLLVMFQQNFKELGVLFLELQRMF